MLNGLDIFSGGGGGALALASWVRPIAYCESDESAQNILLTRQQEGQIPIAPIWDDIRTLERRHIPIPVDIIYGGSPCQDFSVAGSKKGLDGEKSNLLLEVFRLISVFRPRFVFLENSPNIIPLGLDRILREFHALRYDVVWTIVSAEEIGAPHLRQRFWLLAHTDCESIREQSVEFSGIEDPTFDRSISEKNPNPDCFRWTERGTFIEQLWSSEIECISRAALNTLCEGRKRWEDAKEAWQALAVGSMSGLGSWPSWLPQPTINRGHHGISNRVDQLQVMGNAWVPQQAIEAFMRLMGLK